MVFLLPSKLPMMGYLFLLFFLLTLSIEDPPYLRFLFPPSFRVWMIVRRRRSREQQDLVIPPENCVQATTSKACRLRLEAELPGSLVVTVKKS